MPMTPGLVPNIRQPGPADPELPFANDEIMVEIAEGSENKQTDDAGNVLRIEYPDGSIAVSLDGRPIEENQDKKDYGNWFRNLVDDIDSITLSSIANELIRGIQDDIETRRDWVEARAKGLQLLGLKIELPGLQGATDGAPVEGMSKVRHPLLLEACLRFQANARSELLPTDGPVKVRNDALASTTQQDSLANALERDLNHYLTAVASEYYPDTDRMLLLVQVRILKRI